MGDSNYGTFPQAQQFHNCNNPSSYPILPSNQLVLHYDALVRSMRTCRPTAERHSSTDTPATWLILPCSIDGFWSNVRQVCDYPQQIL